MRKFKYSLIAVLLFVGVALAANIATKSISITINPTVQPLAITANLPGAGYAGYGYSGNFSATGGVAPYTWSVASGSLPPGLVLDPNSGLLSGTPTTAGTYTFTIQVQDSMNTVSKAQVTTAR